MNRLQEDTRDQRRKSPKRLGESRKVFKESVIRAVSFFLYSFVCSFKCKIRRSMKEWEYRVPGGSNTCGTQRGKSLKNVTNYISI